MERPILFQDRLVRANLADLKTRTRRVGPGAARWLKLQKGDRLWVRECWRHGPDGIEYRADENSWQHHHENGTLHEWRRRAETRASTPWRPSIHMPRSACRLRLELTQDPWVEPLQAITEEEAIREGVRRRRVPADGILVEHDEWQDADGFWHMTARDAFHRLWNSINAARGYGWDSNPNVVVLAYRRLT